MELRHGGTGPQLAVFLVKQLSKFGRHSIQLKAFSLLLGIQEGRAAAFSLRKKPIDAEAPLYTYREML
jgi:hypothetical protein